jgi:hypothetical protein
MIAWSTSTRFRLLGLAAVALAVGVSIAGVPVTSAQGTTLFAARADGPLPVDHPWDPAWDGVAPVSVAMTGQLVTPPMLETPAFPAVRVRSLVDGSRLAVLVEWDDPTLDDSVLAVDRFADAAAMQIALGSGTSICMGQLAGGLNIWHWKADWAADLAGRRDVDQAHPNMPDDVHFPTSESDPSLTDAGFLSGQAAGNPRSGAALTSSVEDLSAIGFGTLTTQPPEAQNVHGASEYRDGVWRVVMSRALSDGDPNDAALRPGGPSAVVAFAVWDGSRGDRDGQKSVSTWLSLALPTPERTLFDEWPLLVLLALALGLSAVVLAYGARQPAVGFGWPEGGPRRDTGVGGPGGEPPGGD